MRRKVGFLLVGTQQPGSSAAAAAEAGVVSRCLFIAKHGNDETLSRLLAALHHRAKRKK
jgi:hypothetical protein